MAFPTDGYLVARVRVFGYVADVSYHVDIELDGEVVTEAFVADVTAALDSALAIARPGETVDTGVTYTGNKTV